MLQVTRKLLIQPDSEEVAEMSKEFAERHCIVLPQLIEGNLLWSILERLGTAAFYHNTHADHRRQEFAKDLTVRENEMALQMVHFLLNNPMLFQIVHRIASCRPIAGFGGRIYCSLPNEEHHLEWHDDTDAGERLVGISINLSSEPYSGGVFQLREKRRRTIFREVGSGNPGDAHIFRITPELQHRVTRVEGTAARTAAAGWFLSESGFLTTIKGPSLTSK